VSKPARLLLVLGAVLLLAGVLAGVVNREVLDGDRFADHVDAIRQDDAVSREIGAALTDEILQAEPDLVVARPAVESAVTTLVRSPAFGPAVRKMVTGIHDAVLAGDGSVVLRLADVGAVLVAALQTVAPELASHLPADLDVTLAQFGGQGPDSTPIRYAHFVEVLSWLLPLLALLCFGGAVLLGRDRGKGLRTVGYAVAGSGLVAGAGVFIAAFVASRVDTDTLEAALGVAVWNELSTPLWVASGLLVAAGYVLVIAWTLRVGVDRRAYARQGLGWLGSPSGTPDVRAAHGAVLLVVGVAAVVQPVTVVKIVVVAAGFVLATQGVVELVDVLRRLGGVRGWLPRVLEGPTARAVVLGITGLVVVAGLVVFNARTPSSALPPLAAQPGTACNGHDELCDRRFDAVAFPATHNSMSAADEPRWFLADQPTGLVNQLDDGIRVFLIDTWPGQTTSRDGLVATADVSRAKAVAEAEDTYGPDVVASALRLRDATGLTPTGPVEPYLCHAMCELGSTKLIDSMKQVKDWLDAHPREVVTLFVQDEVSPKDFAEDMDSAGLVPMTRTHDAGAPWPTLREMISSGKRLVVLAENRGGGTTYPWLLQGFDQVQDTPYDAKKPSDFSCKRLRGPADAALFLVNHWLNNPQRRVSDATAVNAADVLGPRLDQCKKERQHIPNFVAVDYYTRGDLLEEVDRLNRLDHQ
jgi:hypothetical protein